MYDYVFCTFSLKNQSQLDFDHSCKYDLEVQSSTSIEMKGKKYSVIFLKRQQLPLFDPTKQREHSFLVDSSFSMD